MFKKIEALTSSAHQDLRFTTINSFEFARNMQHSPLGVSELAMASRFYPILFPKKDTTPMALLSLDQNNNHYVNTDGSWKVPYIPAHFRRYPFILANADEEKPDRFVVCIDREAPHFAADLGDPMFTADGTPADFTQHTIDFLQKFQEEMGITKTICQELEQHGVLANKTINIEKKGKKSTIGGFRCVDMKKLVTLDDTTLAGWVKNGLMGIVYTHLQSLDNVKVLAA
ncbi:MAG: SapC family protein [Desulfobacterium sp.]|nr:SapC family protein [Desulfobacterium sp.]